MRQDETNDMNDVMNTRAMRALFQSFRQPRPRLRRQNVGFGDVIFVHGVNRVPRTERSDTTGLGFRVLGFRVLGFRVLGS